MPTEVTLHRCRFAQVDVSAIDALALDAAGAQLAVARADGNVELWRTRNKRHGWLLQAVVPGAEGQTVSALAWAEGRVLGTSHTLTPTKGEVFQLDFSTLTKSRHSDSFGGAAWSCAVDPAQATLAVGCEDGGVRLFALGDGGLDYYRTLVTGHSRVLCVAWHPTAEQLWGGCADGVIRRWCPTSGALEARVTLPGLTRGEAPIVWSLAVLSDSTLVSGDSLGRVQVWDGEAGVLVSSHQKHAAAVLAVAVADDESRVFASGVDAQVVMLERTPRGEWVYSYAHRPHTHDVRALAAARGLLVSGGVDAQLCTLPASAAFRQRRATKIPPFSHWPALRAQLAPAGRRLLVQRRHSVELWSVEGALVAELRLATGGRNVTCSAVSADGKWVAAAAADGDVRLFRVGAKRVRRFGCVSVEPGRTVSALAFSPADARVLFAAAGPQLLALRDGEPQQTFDLAGHVALAVAASADGAWVATATLGDELRVFSVDTGALHFAVQCADPPTAVAFHPASPSLVVAYASNRFDIYDVEERRVADWSKAYGARLPDELLQRPQPVSGISFDPGNPSSVLLTSHGFLCHVDLDRATPGSSAAGDGGDGGGERPAKRARGGSEPAAGPLDGFVLLNKYRPAISAGFIAPGELAVVETPWIKIMSTFPDALFRQQYGT